MLSLLSEYGYLTGLELQYGSASLLACQYIVELLRTRLALATETPARFVTSAMEASCITILIYLLIVIIFCYVLVITLFTRCFDSFEVVSGLLENGLAIVTGVFLVATIIITALGKEAKDAQFGTGSLEPSSTPAPEQSRYEATYRR